MIQRCTNQSAPNYDRYGGAGATVCKRWQGADGFAHFLEDMGERPSTKYSLDRYPKHDGKYEPKNCRWATHTQQMANRGDYNVNLTIDGETMCKSAWCKRFGISPQLFNGRVKRGWTVDEAIKTPARPLRRNTT